MAGAPAGMPAVADASASARSAAGLPLRAVSNLLPPLTSVQAAQSAKRARANCPAKKLPLTSMSRSSALSSAQRFVQGKLGAKAMRAFRASRQYRSLTAVRKLKAAAGANGNLAGALAFALREHELAPGDPGPLVDAAAILTNVGKPREALALLDAADRTRRTVAAPMGLDGAAIALNNRGYALLRMGQYAKARAVLGKAIAREPLLSEARTNRSAASLCERPQLTWLNAGRTRSRQPPAVPPPVAETVALAPLGSVPAPEYEPVPRSSGELRFKAGGDGYEAVVDQLVAGILPLRGSIPPNEGGADPCGFHYPRSVDFATGCIAAAFVQVLSNEKASAVARAPQDHSADGLQLQAAVFFANTVVERNGEFPTCAAGDAWWASLQPVFERVRAEQLRWSGAYLALAREYAASLSDPIARKVIIWVARDKILAQQIEWAQDLDIVGGYIKTACSGENGGADPVHPPGGAEDPGCQLPDWLGFDNGFVELHWDCEQRFVEFHTPSPLSPFFRISQSLTKDTTTFMYGGKASVSVLKGTPVGKWVSAGASTKLGVYATFTKLNPLDRSNRMVDYGVVTPSHPSASVKAFNVKVSAPVDRVVGAFGWSP